MDYQEFTDKLVSLGLKKSEFMRYIGMGRTTITNWANDNKVPHLVALHLDLLIKIKGLLPDLSRFKASADKEDQQ